VQVHSLEDRLRLERDVYRKCLDLVQAEDPTPLLTDTLEVLRGRVGAERGYIEITDLETPGSPQWAASVGADAAEKNTIVARISKGVIAAAIESGEAIQTPSAALDERFQHRESVQQGAIEAVLCAPLRSHGCVGVVYLQNREAGGEFSADDVDCVKRVAQFVGGLAGRLFEVRRRRSLEDRTASVRARMRAEGVIGISRALAETMQRLEAIAGLDANVLLLGDSGVGKSLFARVLHDNSPRRSGPFVEVNCAALPASLIESELFGAERGAHSAVAVHGLIGKIAAAEGGTLFLDEIADLPIDAQAKLLQLIQSKEYYRLGGSRAVRADIRIVTATNHDIEQAIRGRTFREDLYYRIRGVELKVPRLAQRREDITLLARHFCAESCARNKLPPLAISPRALAALEFADWPGNVRQLANTCERAIVEAKIAGADEVDVHHVFPEQPAPDAAQTFHGARHQWERTFLAQSLSSSQWNVSAVARQLDLSRSHLNALMSRHQLRRESTYQRTEVDDVDNS